MILPVEGKGGFNILVAAGHSFRYVFNSDFFFLFSQDRAQEGNIQVKGYIIFVFNGVIYIFNEKT